MFTRQHFLAATIVGVGMTGLLSLPADAEVVAKPCPYNCESAGIPRAHCKDWRADGECFVEDLRAAHNPQGRSALDIARDEAGQDREISMVQKLIPASGREKVDLDDDDRITKIDVVARRQQGGTETKLQASLEDGTPLGAVQQVDQNSNHVLRFNVGSLNPKGEELILTALNGDVYVESVHVFYED